MILILLEWLSHLNEPEASNFPNNSNHQSFQLETHTFSVPNRLHLPTSASLQKLVWAFDVAPKFCHQDQLSAMWHNMFLLLFRWYHPNHLWINAILLHFVLPSKTLSIHAPNCTFLSRSGQLIPAILSNISNMLLFAHGHRISHLPSDLPTLSTSNQITIVKKIKHYSDI